MLRVPRVTQLVLVCLAFLSPVVHAKGPYEEDIRFALTELEARCGKFFSVKEIDWKQVSRQFQRESRAVRTPQDHRVLLVRLLARLKDGHAAVRPLEKGKNTRWPDAAEKNKVLPGMFWCRSGKRLLVKQSWGAAAAQGIRPGMEVVGVNGLAAGKWLKRRTAQLVDTWSFSTAHQAFSFASHWGLANHPGSKLQLTMRSAKGKRGRVTVTYGGDPKAYVRVGPAFLPEGVTQDVTQNRGIAFGRTPEGYGYIHIARCPGNLPELIDKPLAELADVPGLILDFRGNSGGGFDHDALLGRFIPTGKTIRFAKRYRSAGPHPYGGPVVVLIDGNVRSAGETAAGMFKEDGRAYMIGESPTAGMSAQKDVIELPSKLFSLYVAVRSNKLRFNSGRGIEGIGVTPHETVAYEARDLSKGIDTLVTRATERLARFPKKKVPYRPEKYGWRPPKTAK